jgi:hypothetical protein
LGSGTTACFCPMTMFRVPGWRPHREARQSWRTPPRIGVQQGFEAMLELPLVPAPLLPPLEALEPDDPDPELPADPLRPAEEPEVPVEEPEPPPLVIPADDPEPPVDEPDPEFRLPVDPG